MLNNLFFLVSVLVLLVGCAILFMDVVVSMKTDRCKIAVPGEYIAKADTGAHSGFFVLTAPTFRYSFEGKTYQERSANLFFPLYLPAGKLAVPFVEGKTYEVFVNPAQPTMIISAGEQRFPFLRKLGCAVALVGVLLVLAAMRMPVLS